ncbi:MAG: hypothetical protein OEW16_11510 [Gammaproteobacteria bacterium]|nr:hypothetical protein [Gammaproteobacteria bacterium]
MPKIPRTILAAFLATAIGLFTVAAAAATGPDHAATYEKLKTLAGAWTGKMEDPLEGPPVTVRYEVASNGKAVIEFQNPGESYEMVTVYYLANGRLQATHYCAAGNQPAYKLGDKSTADLALFEFAGGTGFDPDKDGHVHQGEIRFLSPDRIEHRWFHYVGPKELGSTQWFLQRQVEIPTEQTPAPEPEPVPTVAPTS